MYQRPSSPGWSSLIVISSTWPLWSHDFMPKPLTLLPHIWTCLSQASVQWWMLQVRQYQSMQMLRLTVSSCKPQQSTTLEVGKGTEGQMLKQRKITWKLHVTQGRSDWLVPQGYMTLLTPGQLFGQHMQAHQWLIFSISCFFFLKKWYCILGNLLTHVVNVKLHWIKCVFK